MFCAFVLAGTSVISARYISGRLGVFTITAASMFFALLFLIPLYWRGLAGALRRLSKRDFLLIFLQALFGMFLFRMFLLTGLLYTSTAEAGILTGATPAITALLAGVLLKEKADKPKLIGILGTVGGIMLLQGFLTSGNAFVMKHFVGNLLVLCAAACESIFNIFSRSFAVKAEEADQYRLPPAVQTIIVSSVTLLLCLIPAFLEHTPPLSAGLGAREWLALAWYGVFVTALAFLCWYLGIQSCGAFTAAAFSGMMPFTSMLLSVVLLGERPYLRQWLGGLFIIAGIILIGGSRPNRPRQSAYTRPNRPPRSAYTRPNRPPQSARTRPEARNGN